MEIKKIKRIIDRELILNSKSKNGGSEEKKRAPPCHYAQAVEVCGV